MPSSPWPEEIKFDVESTRLTSIHERQSKDAQSYLAEWDSPQNHENPRNWSTLKKSAHLIPVSLLCLSVTAGASMITPGSFAIAATFHLSHTAALLPLSLFVLGLAIGPLLAAPISETRGRSVVYKFTLPLYILFILGAGCVQSFAGLLACRTLAALAGAPCLAVAAGTLADLFEPHRIGSPASLVVVAPFLGPCLGPILGGCTATRTEYRWTQFTTALIALASWILILPTYETHRGVLLKRKAQRDGLPPPEPELAPREAIQQLLTVVITRPIRMIFSEPVVILFSIYNAFTFSILFAFFVGYPYVFIKTYQFSLQQSGVTFVGIGLGAIVGAMGAGMVDRLVYQRSFDREPEGRLYIGMVGSFCIPISLVWFALSARPSVHWIVPVLSGVPFAFGIVTIFISSALYMLDVYGPSKGASAMAANGLLRYSMGAAFPLFTLQMYESLGITWATLLLAYICVLMVPIPFVFYLYGARLRGCVPENAATQGLHDTKLNN